MSIIIGVKGRNLETGKPEGEKKMRITKDEIEEAIEMYVNSVYDLGSESGWISASFEQWVKATYDELTTWKSDGFGCSYQSNENRFDGKESIVKRIRPLLKKRLAELKEEGYDIKAI